MDPFTPDGEWQRVSPALIRARRTSLLLVYVLVVVGLVLLWVLAAPRWLAVLATVAALVVLVWAWWLIGRRVRSWGYALRDDDLLVGSGILFRRLVVVPYGRMQLVDVVAGPIDRWCGVATVQLHTAAATTDAAIPGLVPQVAADLRDRLAQLGEARSAGL